MKWASWTTLLLGLWSMATPFAFGHAGAGAWNEVSLGAAIVVASAWAAFSKASAAVIASAFVMLAGLWIVMAPFFFTHRPASIAIWNELTVGTAVLLLGAARALNPGERHGA